MPGHPVIPLKPLLIRSPSPILSQIAQWNFADPFVVRLLQSDIPLRMKHDSFRFWGYWNPQNQMVGFSCLDICDDCREFTSGHLHTYIPLLATHPDHQGRGHGKSILRHLIAEAVLLCRSREDCGDVLFLDVYLSSADAIKLYTKNGFIQVNSEPIPDPEESGKPFIVMAQRVSLAPA